jgi:hypothetical protein
MPAATSSVTPPGTATVAVFYDATGNILEVQHYDGLAWKGVTGHRGASGQQIWPGKALKKVEPAYFIKTVDDTDPCIWQGNILYCW